MEVAPSRAEGQLPLSSPERSDDGVSPEIGAKKPTHSLSISSVQPVAAQSFERYSTSPPPSSSSAKSDDETGPNSANQKSGSLLPGGSSNLNPKRKRSISAVRDGKSRSRARASNASVRVNITTPTGNDDEEKSVQNDSYSRAADINPSHTMTVAHIRRNANGTVGSVYSGNKIRHLKKEDGIPLWRKDIQFLFLREVFEDKTPAFTDISDGSKGHTFTDVYIKAMSKSNKTSRILREKLVTEREAAVNMAMVCLLVNVGRMNTTLNFFPEMRAQLRTYHSIPCLQAHQDPNAYKQLQDAPRLKSILKGACEELDSINTIEKIKALAVPRTNPVHLIFVLSQYAPKISELHFTQPRDFFDLVIRSTLSSKSRAKAFLWLVWYYLESDFSKDQALNNPFGSGQYGEGEDAAELPIKVPAFEHLTEEQAAAENVDTEEEKQYGELKRLERKRILEEDETVGPPMKKTRGPAHNDLMDDAMASSPVHGMHHGSDSGGSRSPSPSNFGRGPNDFFKGPCSSNLLPQPGPGGWSKGNLAPKPATQPQRLILKHRSSTSNIPPHSSSPAPPGSSAHPILHPTSTAITSHPSRRPRHETSHQRAINNNRRKRIDRILHRKLVTEQISIRRKTRSRTSTLGFRAMMRIMDLPDNYDSEEEDANWGPGGILPRPDRDEMDWGAEARRLRRVLARAERRFVREDGAKVLSHPRQGAERPADRKVVHDAEATNKTTAIAATNGTAPAPSRRGARKPASTATPDGSVAPSRSRRAAASRRSQAAKNGATPSRPDESDAPPPSTTKSSTAAQQALNDLDMDLLGEEDSPAGTPAPLSRSRKASSSRPIAPSTAATALEDESFMTANENDDMGEADDTMDLDLDRTAGLRDDEDEEDALSDEDEDGDVADERVEGGRGREGREAGSTRDVVELSDYSSAEGEDEDDRGLVGVDAEADAEAGYVSGEGADAVDDSGDDDDSEESSSGGDD
ncbi:hypothetical protein MMC25_001513 [Agyrium rufum]|nr:hypothetical protein [Agyrium rufum]